MKVLSIDSEDRRVEVNWVSSHVIKAIYVLSAADHMLL